MILQHLECIINETEPWKLERNLGETIDRYLSFYNRSENSISDFEYRIEYQMSGNIYSALVYAHWMEQEP